MVSWTVKLAEVGLLPIYHADTFTFPLLNIFREKSIQVKITLSH